MSTEHHCEKCPHDLTVIHRWANGKYLGAVPIVFLLNEDLLDEYVREVDGDTRRISTDPPSPINNIRAEILRRMNAAK